MENNKQNQNPHILIIAYPLQGHVIPVVNLALKLASNGFTITFVNTHSIHHQQTRAQHNKTEDDLFAEARKSGLDIRYRTVSDGLPLGFDRSLNHDQFMESLLHVFSAHVDELVGNIVEMNPEVSCLITDTFFVWSSMIAKKYNLVNISFWTETALIIREDTIDYIPGVAAIEPKDLMSYLQAADTRTVVHQIISKSFENVRKADFIICNTVQELESETISALQKKHPTFAIGPIFPTGFTKSVVTTSLWSEYECTQWLNTKPHSSVLYVSFGSYAHVSKEEIEEIALGLLLSEVNFIWVGLNLCDNKRISRDEVSEKIHRLMSGKWNDELRMNVIGVRNTIEKALSKDGSSEKNFNQLINDMKIKILEKRGS
ncbi:hypothetical protein Patl1_32153 [Pistacia atlantica]|uniref:Uncharacterized protein n=1 Tax=Pistacia atlantica TaxID=434234 RepID=A0ACC1AMB3_9ROSI|nr:hypothetical protein Patl1_32153 [Pistacia atlantica]